ncbi:multiple organellar RNA editing factor 3, mitochondrial-like isoform X2 [Gossypium arboreum]|uniref:multiple organellar RNA editing factor 3, mitochondrial-like isoform X2 n=1 Tax=Gossypium arboreum TaxID=29729 RepID=UPI0022F17F0A|nr:multiple organellar RNA editing factor 3, mitochondrial-like isoform X2 [Gossypium arboreum]
MACLNARRSLSTLLSRALTSSSSFPSRSRLTVALLNSTPVFIPEATKILTRTKTSGSGYSPLNDPSPNWSNPPAAVDYEHWLIILEFSQRPKPLEEEMIDAYVKTLASVVGSEEEAKKRIYSVCTTRYTGFRAFFPGPFIYDVIGLPHVRWVLPAEFIGGRDYYFGGDLFVDGKVLRRPQLNPRVGVSNSSHRVGGRGDDDLWVITFRFPKDQEPSLQEQIDLYVKTLASVVGRLLIPSNLGISGNLRNGFYFSFLFVVKRKRKREYAVSSPTSWYAGFRAFISEEMAHELSGLPLVEGFYRDSEVQHRNEDICGGPDT